jgi:hypothetical protein
MEQRAVDTYAGYQLLKLLQMSHFLKINLALQQLFSFFKVFCSIKLFKIFSAYLKMEADSTKPSSTLVSVPWQNN